MADDILIRKATRNDARKVHELMKQRAAEKNIDLPFHFSYEVLVEGCWDSGSVVVAFVAERSGGTGELEGYILGNRSYCPWLSRIMTIKEVYVIPSDYRSNVALQLCKELIQTAIIMGCERCDMRASKADEVMVILAEYLDAINVTDIDGWHCFSLDSYMVINYAAKNVYERPIVIRPSVPEDMESVMMMIQELADFEKMSDSPKINADILRRDSPPREKFFNCFVAEDNGTLVGYAMYYPTFSSAGHGMCLEDFYVKPDYRGHGLGTLLMAEVAKRGFNIGAQHIELIVLSWNIASIAFYKNRGGTDVTADKHVQLYRIDHRKMSRSVE